MRFVRSSGLIAELSASRKGNALTRNIDHDLAVECIRSPVLQKLMRLTDSGERQNRTDDGLHQAALDQRCERIQLSAVLSCEDEVIGGVLPPRLDEVLRLSDVDDRDHPSPVG